MKKLFLLIAFPALFSLTVQAQNDSESRKPGAGDITTELNLGLFNSGITINNIVNQLRGRYFLSPNTVVRLGFNASRTSQQEDAFSPNDFSTTYKNSTISINPGIEKHFAGTDRLSPFVGLELAFTTYNVNETQERETGPSRKIKYLNARSCGNNKLTERGFISTGLNAVAGVDYYFARHFYAGLELGYGVAVTKQKEAERLTDGNTDFKIAGNTNANIGAYANRGIRIGFVF